MNRQRNIAATLAVSLSLVAGGAQAQVSTDELAALRAQLAALQERLAALEAAQQSQASQLEEVTTANADQQESIDQGADNLARALGESASSGWLARWQWRGDLRYRNENIDAEGAVARNRDRIRGRFGALARVNDTVRVEWQLSTAENADARSTNVTLSDANSRKSVYIDLAYGEWTPNEQWRLTAGKMKMPWTRVGSYFYDGDVNPEGFAANWQQGPTGWFASSFVTRLAERSAIVDSEMLGAQLGFRDTTASSDRYLMALSYLDHRAVEGVAAIGARQGDAHDVAVANGGDRGAHALHPEDAEARRGDRGAAGGRAVKERHAVAQLVPDARVDRELTARKLPTPIADERDLRPHVHLRAIILRCIPADRLHNEPHILVQPSGSRYQDTLRRDR